MNTNFINKRFLAKSMASLFFMLTIGVSDVYGDYNTWLRASTDDTGKGLVYASSNHDQTPADDAYGALVMSDCVQGSNGAKQTFYGWAKPARGYAFATWTAYKYYGDDAKASEGNASFPSPKQVTGVGDLIYAASWSGGAGDDAARSVKASWKAATSYNVVYKEPVGGSYTVDYSYVTVNSSAKFETSTEKLELTPGSGNKRPYGIPDGSQEDLSYATDVVTLSTDAENFVAWVEDGVGKSMANPYVYPVTKNANVTALFKWAEPVAPDDKLIHTTDNSTDVNESVVFEMGYVASVWTTADFTVTLVDATGSGTFTLGTYSYNATDKKLTIPFTYNANGHWDEGSSVAVQVTPSYGATKSVLVRAIAQQNETEQARVSGDGFATQEGNLTDMLAIANANTNATLTLLQSVAVSEPLVVTASMTLDLNNYVLSSTEADKIISIEGTDAKLTVVDNSFLKGSEIQLTRSSNAAIAAIEVTGANRLVYNCGKMTVVNNAEYDSNEEAKAYGIYVSDAGNAVMLGGSISVTSDRYARGVYIETTTGNATLNEGKIEATADLYAVALYSSGTINVEEGVSLKATATDNWAAPLYIIGGTAVVNNVAMTSIATNNNAYGVYVKAGTLTLNGGVITATSATPSVYGVYIAKSGKVTILQQANITAEYTTTDVAGSATLQAYGIQNLGTVKLVNANVTAISPANYATAVNTVTSAKTTTIEGGTYASQTATGYAYGLHHQYKTLSVDGGTFIAIAAGNEVFGVRTTQAATIKNATIIAETTGSAKNAYGVVGAGSKKKVVLTNCTVKAKSATSGAYAIYNSSYLTATGCTLNAKTLGSTTANGLYAKTGTATLTNTDAVVDAFTTTAYGINLVAGTLTVDGGTYEVSVNQATATKAADSKVYGVFVTDGKAATLSNATFHVAATNGSFSQKAYGAYTGTGTINSTGCSYSVSAAASSYGVFGNASSTLNLQNNTILASTIGTTTALGVYSAGTFTVDGDDVTTNTKTYTSYALYFKATAQGEVLGGKFRAKGSSSKSTEILAPINTEALAENVQVKGGFFSDNVRLRYYVPTGYEIFGVDPNAPEYAENYYYTVNDHLPYENICYITEKNVGFPTLEEAFDYARNHSGSTYNIIMTQPYTLPAGNYSLPANATLVVPDRVSRTTAIGIKAERQTPNQDLITENRCLTFASGANLDVYGTIEVSAKQYTLNTGRISYVLGPYGRIHLIEGSTVTLNNGAKINAWGYITGDGEIRVKNGAEVREFFQVHDMKAASAIPDWTTTDNKNIYKAFLMNQYYIQSVEAPTKYYYGGKLIGSMSITSNATAWVTVDADSVKLVGTNDAFFTVDTEDESSWVRKKYDPITDRILWETNSSASLGSISVSMSSYGFDSKDYTLPFTNNMTVHALSGIFNITQSVVLLPGSEIIVDKTATLHVNEKDVNGDNMGLYLYDKSQWSTAATPVMYSPSWTNGVCPRSTAVADMKDAAIYVKGKIEVEGALYTTEGGAAIYSDNENAGTIEFSANAGADGNLYQKYDGSVSVPVTAAKLRNGGETGPDEDMTATKGVAQEGDTYAYANMDGTGFKWTRLKTIDECTIADETDPEHPIYYAKPQGYVAITSDMEDATTHLFYSVEGEGDAKRKFINMPSEAGCQWWEVTATETEGVYYCATNDTYYIYSDLDETWLEYTVDVTFYQDEAGTIEQKVLTVKYGAKPDASIVSNPSKQEDAAATYQFYGWKSSKTENEYLYTAELETVTEDMYYLPVFTSITKKYTVTFKEAKNGVDAPVEVFYGVHPSYAPFKNPTPQYTYFFQHWLASDETTQYAIDAELPIVTDNDHYTAVWAQIPNKYSVIWKNGDEVLETDTKQEYGVAVSYDGEAPARETDANFVYTFDGWSLTDGGDKLEALPTVTGEMTFYAHYSTTPRYVIIFANYNGAALQTESVTAGEHPVYKGLTPGRVRDVDGYFRFKGWKDSKGTSFAPNATFPAVTGKETYTAQYDYVTELYTITLENVDGADASWSGKFGVGATPFYNRDDNDVAVTPTKAAVKAYTYTFDYWQDSENNHYALNELPAVTGDATYTAVFASETRKYNITFKNLDGNAATQQVIAVNYNTSKTALGNLAPTPKKEDNYYTYDFTGWSPALAKVTAKKTYTATFSEEGTPRTFPITFDPDNGVDEPYVVQVPYGEIPSTTNPTKAGDEAQDYTFSGWTPALTAVDGPATYTAQYTPSIRTFVITFKDYDGSTIKTSHFSYGVMPTADDPTRPMDVANRKMYPFSGWEPAIASVTEDATYTAVYDEITFVATVTTAANVTTYHATWEEAFSEANKSDNCTIKLYADATASAVSSANVTKNMTVDLNGYTLSCSSDNTSYTKMFYISGSYTLTINDSKGSGHDGVLSFTGSGNTNYYMFGVYGSSSIVTVNGGNICMNYAGASASYRGSIAFLYLGTSTINVYGGVLDARATAGKAYAIDHDGSSYGVANIYGGKLKASTEIIKDRRANKNFLYGGYYSMSPGTSGSDITLATGKLVCVVPDSDPLRAEGYLYKVAPGYAITWQNDDESTLKTENWETGTTPAYMGAEPSKSNSGQYVYAFTGWDPAVAAVTAAATYKATYSLVGIDADQSDEPLVVDQDMDLQTTTVRVSGTLEIVEGKTLTTDNLILEAGMDNSGQLLGAGNIVAENVYFDLKLNTEARHWHAFGVPWNVDVTEHALTEVETGRTLVVGRDCEIVYYNGAKRASQGAGAHCWEYLKHYYGDGQVDVMTPGQGYMIAFASAVQTVRLTKATGAPIIYTGTVDLAANSGDQDNGGWNAMANPEAFHAAMASGPTVGYVHDGGEIGSDGYEVYDLEAKKFIVGKMVYVQAAGEQHIEFNASSATPISPAAAPKRTRAESVAAKTYLALSDYYAISLSNGEKASKVYVLPEEGKADKYVIGHDLSQFSMSAQKPQVWVKRYDTKLALNTTAPVDGVAEYPVSLYAPVSGEYTITNIQSPIGDDNYTVYLTRDGQAIWNLSDSPYVLTLSNGTTKGYGLRLTRKAPHVTTGMDEAIVDAQGETRKVLIENQVYIIREGNVYGIDGQLVK